MSSVVDKFATRIGKHDIVFIHEGVAQPAAAGRPFANRLSVQWVLCVETLYCSSVSSAKPPTPDQVQVLKHIYDRCLLEQTEWDKGLQKTLTAVLGTACETHASRWLCVSSF